MASKLKVLIIYDSKYGNTRAAAEKIAEGIKETARIDVNLGYVKEVDAGKLAEADAIVLGAPNHMGRPSQTMKKFVKSLDAAKLKAKSVAVFGTYSGSPREDRGVKKLVALADKCLPNVKLLLPGLSVRVNGIPGPIVESELPKCVEFGRKIAAKLA